MKEANYQGLWSGMTEVTRDAFKRLSSAKYERLPEASIDGRTYSALLKRGLIQLHVGGLVYLTDAGRKLKAHVAAARRHGRAARRGRVQAKPDYEDKIGGDF